MLQITKMNSTKWHHSIVNIYISHRIVRAKNKIILLEEFVKKISFHVIAT